MSKKKNKLANAFSIVDSTNVVGMYEAHLLAANQEIEMCIVALHRAKAKRREIEIQLRRARRLCARLGLGWHGGMDKM